ATFECRLDGGGYSQCASPKNYTGLADGAHTFEVRAIDAVGNADQSPAVRTWNVDTAPPTPAPVLTAVPDGGSVVLNWTASADAGAGVVAYDIYRDASLLATVAATVTSYTDTSVASATSYTYRVDARDGAGNATASLTVAVVTTDTVAPDTTIDSGPADGSTDTESSRSFTFSSNEAGSTFECRLDSPVFVVCSSPYRYSVADGAHTFAVRATDAAGNTDPSPAQRTWNVDATPPETTITDGPNDPASTDTATFAFSSNESGATFRCALDAAAFTTCQSPKTYTGLTDARHTFAVAATDAAGHTDPSPATRTWTVAAPPETTIDSGPSGTVRTKEVQFTFSSSEAGSTFECRIG
ncbi:MAG: fibronectin type III domain-containing protein, partial [Actinobacteria bacterium]|nr:fibronectin type III domain-containing protein [Actinomycetota bacterium]